MNVCEYYSRNGQVSLTNWSLDDDDVEDVALDWEGMEVCKKTDDSTIGMLLNLEEGMLHLTVFKNNRFLGVMTNGLAGSYCWYTEVGDDDEVSNRGGTSPTTVMR